MHRDICPTNFLIGVGPEQNKIYTIDFGIAKKYKKDDDNTHIPFIEYKKFKGNRFSSVNAHKGF